jgi:hypothetical protein
MGTTPGQFVGDQNGSLPGHAGEHGQGINHGNGLQRVHPNPHAHKS